MERKIIKLLIIIIMISCKSNYDVKKEEPVVYLYVLDTLSDWEVGYITAELNSKRYLDKSRMSLSLITVGNTKESIKTMGGLSITPDECIDSIKFKSGDLLILPGANTWMDESNKKIITLIPGLLEERVKIAAICGATIALAQNGILNKINHTSNDKGYLEMTCPGYSGSDYYINRPVVVDDNLITATGIAPLEFSYEVFKIINAMKKDTLEAWYQLYKTKEPKYFYNLMESLNGAW